MRPALIALLAGLSGAAGAQPEAAPAGSTAFCLFALPAEGGTQRHINLGIVQYVEVRADAVLITYGGGNLGSGYEARLPVRSRDEAATVLTRLRQAAADCAAARPLNEDARR